MTRERGNPGACLRRGSADAVSPQLPHVLKPTAERWSRQGCRMPVNCRHRIHDLAECRP